jgi:hypothetical protein
MRHVQYLFRFGWSVICQAVKSSFQTGLHVPYLSSNHGDSNIPFDKNLFSHFKLDPSFLIWTRIYMYFVRTIGQIG